MSAGLALGTAQWGMAYGIANRTGRPSPEHAAEMLRRASAAGVSLLDTARAYGESEALLGRLLKGDSHWRIVTKLAPDVACPEGSEDEALARVARSLEQSRSALQRDHLDAVLLHRAGHRLAFRGAIWRLLREQRLAGRIGALGVSTASPQEALRLLDDPEIELLQVASSLLDQRLARANFFSRAAAAGIAVQVRSVFLQGVAHLSADALPPQLSECAAPLAAIRRFAACRGVTPRCVFLAHARSLPVGVRPASPGGVSARLAGGQLVIGCENPAQLCEILADWSAAALDPRALADLADTLPPLPDRVLDPWRWPAGLRAQPGHAPPPPPR